MKGNKKLLSALLAAAMVGQMGVVVGLADGSCAANEHGRKVRVTTACTAADKHWLGRSDAGTLQGGEKGTNYFYPTVSNTTINCAGSKNVIIFKDSSLTDVTISNFGENDVIYCSGNSALIITKNDNGFEISNEDGNATVGTITLNKDTSLDDITPSQLPAAPLSATLNDQLEVVDLSNAVGTATYLWQRNDGKGGTAFTDIPGADTTKNSITAGTEEGNWTYRCVVIDEAGQVKETNTVTKVIGCAYTPAFVDNIKATAPKADGTNIDWTTGAPFELAADDAAAYTFTLSNPVTYSGDYCDKKDGDNHGYTTTWTKNGEGDFPAGVALAENGVLTVKANEVIAGTHEVKLSVSVAKLDADNSKTGYTKSDIVFTVKKAAPDTTTDETDQGDTGNTGEGNTDPEKPGETTDPDPNKPGEGTGGETTDPQPEEPKFEITIGKDPDKTDSAPNEITIGKDTAEKSSYVYKAVIPDNITTPYNFDWTLKTENGQKAPDYITVAPAGNTATVTIDKTKLPPQQKIDQKFTLTVILTPAQSKVRAANAADQNSNQLSATYEITVHADTTQNQDTGGPAPTACTRTIKNVTVTPKVTSPLHFKENDPDKVVDWTYSVEWNNDCQIPNCTHKTEDLIWKVNSTKTSDWAVLDVNVDTTQKSGKLTILAGKIPDLKDNKITFAAYTKKADGTEDKPVTTAGEITVTRDPKCERTISAITKIQSLPGSSAAVNVVKNKTADFNYIAIPEYSTDGVCEKAPEHNKMDGHGGVITWSIDSVKRKNAAETITDSETRAFSIGKENGSLHVNGRNLVAGKVYEVIISATAANDAKVTTPATITVTCTPASSGSGGGSSGGSSSSDDRDDSDWYQWQDFEDDISDAKKGTTVKVNLRDNTDMPFYIFDEARGRDVTLQMKVSGGYTWTVNGKTIKKLPENQVWVALGVKSYKNSKMSTLCRDNDIKSFELENNGSFYGDMKLTMNLGSSHAKKTVYLYSYDEDKNKLTYNSSAKVDEDGDASFVFARSLGAYVVTSKALYGESPVGSGGGAVGSGNNPTTVYPPVASVPASKPPVSSSSSSGSSSSSEPAPPPAEPSSTPDTTPVDVVTEPEQKAKIPVLVPVLILSIAGVITATVLVVRSGKGKDDFDA